MPKQEDTIKDASASIKREAAVKPCLLYTSILIKVKYSKLSLDNDNAERQLMGKSHMTSP